MLLPAAEEITLSSYLSSHFYGRLQLFEDKIFREAVLHWSKGKCALKVLSQPVILLSTFQRLCCQAMVLPLRLISLRICNA